MQGSQQQVFYTFCLPPQKKSVRLCMYVYVKKNKLIRIVSIQFYRKHVDYLKLKNMLNTNKLTNGQPSKIHSRFIYLQLITTELETFNNTTKDYKLVSNN